MSLFLDQVGAAATLVLNLSYGSSPSQVLDVYRVDSMAAVPAVVVAFGGGWAGGDRYDGAGHLHREQILSFLRHGINVVNINYRLSGEAPYPAAVQDVTAALEWTRTYGPAYGIDPTRVGVWGASAGGHLALLGAFQDPQIRVVGAASSPTDLRAWDADSVAYGCGLCNGTGFRTPTSVLSQFLGVDTSQNDQTTLQALYEASPVAYATRSNRRRLAVQLTVGVRDCAVPANQSDRLVSALNATLQERFLPRREARVPPVEVVRFEAGHNDGDFLLPESVDRVSAFFAANF